MLSKQNLVSTFLSKTTQSMMTWIYRRQRNNLMFHTNNLFYILLLLCGDRHIIKLGLIKWTVLHARQACSSSSTIYEQRRFMDGAVWMKRFEFEAVVGRFAMATQPWGDPCLPGRGRIRRVSRPTDIACTPASWCPRIPPPSTLRTSSRAVRGRSGTKRAGSPRSWPWRWSSRESPPPAGTADEGRRFRTCSGLPVCPEARCGCGLTFSPSSCSPLAVVEEEEPALWDGKSSSS